MIFVAGLPVSSVNQPPLSPTTVVVDQEEPDDAPFSEVEQPEPICQDFSQARVVILEGLLVEQSASLFEILARVDLGGLLVRALLVAHDEHLALDLSVPRPILAQVLREHDQVRVPVHAQVGEVEVH